MSVKTERLYIRTTSPKKEFLQEIADRDYGGEITAVIDAMVERLIEEERQSEE